MPEPQTSDMRQIVSMCQTPSKRRTDGRTDSQMSGIEFGASVTSDGNNFNEFHDNWPNF